MWVAAADCRRFFLLARPHCGMGVPKPFYLPCAMCDISLFSCRRPWSRGNFHILAPSQ